MIGIGVGIRVGVRIGVIGIGVGIGMIGIGVGIGMIGIGVGIRIGDRVDIRDRIRVDMRIWSHQIWIMFLIKKCMIETAIIVLGAPQYTVPTVWIIHGEALTGAESKTGTIIAISTSGYPCSSLMRPIIEPVITSA